ncbi:MAG TPA: PilZ domain-containing protein [Deltaproteobacteria bacterium]|nr:PilZ domain-containing protein [Deltaproteobacteria bacterium]
MPYTKEKRCFERIRVPNICGMVELKGGKKEVSIVNACSGGVCIAGVEMDLGDIVRLFIDHPETVGTISLYCKVVWVESKGDEIGYSGLALLNTNRILFEQELESFGRLIAAATGNT